MKAWSVSRRASTLVLASCLLSLPSASFAAQPGGGGDAAGEGAGKLDEAREHYKRGLQLYEDGDFTAARVEFDRAYALAPTYRIFYNSGLCSKQLNDYVAALTAFQRYLAEGGPEIPDDRRSEVTKLIAELKPRIASLVVTTNVPDADVAVDDVPVGHTPFKEPVLVNPGRRKVSVTKQGYFPANKSIIVAGSDKASINLELTEVAKDHPIAEKKSRSSVPYITWGLTAAVGVAAVITGVLAIKSSNDQKAMLDHFGTSQDDLENARTKTQTLSGTADILGAVTIVGAAASLYLTFKLWGHENADGSTSVKVQNDRAPSSSASIGLGGSNVVLRGSF